MVSALDSGSSGPGSSGPGSSPGRDIVLSSWPRHLTQVYKSVDPGEFNAGVTLRWTSMATP